MTELPPEINRIAAEYGATLVPYPPMDSQLIFIDGTNRKRVENGELAGMDEQELRVLFNGLKNPPKLQELVYVGLRTVARNKSNPVYVEVQS